MLGRECTNVLGASERPAAGQYQHHCGVAQDGVGQLVDCRGPDPIGEAVGEDHPQCGRHPLDGGVPVPMGQFEHQTGLVGEHPSQHPVLTETHDGQRERLDIVIRLWPTAFQFFGNVGEKYRVLAVDDGRDQFVAPGEAPVDGGAADPRATGYVVERDPAEAVLFELDDGGVEDGSGRGVSGYNRHGQTRCSAAASEDGPTPS